jgi:hypothetical protein
VDGKNVNARKASWRCRLGMHGYTATTTDEGVKYLVCARCGREHFPGSSFNSMPNG